MSENSDKEGVEPELKGSHDAIGEENAAAVAAGESQVMVHNLVEKRSPEENPAKEWDGDGVAEENAVKEKDGSALVENSISEHGSSTPAAIPTNGLDSTPSTQNVLNEKASPTSTGTLIGKEDKLDPTGNFANVQNDSVPKENTINNQKDSGVLNSSPKQHLTVHIDDTKAAKTNNGSADHDNVENMENSDKEAGASNVKADKSDFGNVKVEGGEQLVDTNVKEAQLGASVKQDDADGELPVPQDVSSKSFFLDMQYEGDGSGTEEEQAAFMKELETFHKEMNLEFKPPKFYGEGLNCLKLWRAVTRLGGYDQVTLCKLWRQVGESFNPPKTCTTVSWSFRCFYEKALLEYEKHKIRTGELQIPVSSYGEPMIVDNQPRNNQTPGSGRAIRESAARAMQGWHSQRLLGSGEVGDAIIKDKTSVSLPKRDKHLKSIGPLKRKKPSSLEHSVKAARRKIAYPLMDTMVVDVGPPADWVKINVRRTKDCFEVYALVPGLLREEVHVQSDPAGRLVISGEPEQLDNPWGVTPFKKIVTLPSRIDPHQTSAVVTLHGQLFVRAPFETADS